MSRPSRGAAALRILFGLMFLVPALQEITDQNLPADLQAWQHWYDQPGAGKLAEFGQRDGWNVCGEE